MGVREQIAYSLTHGNLTQDANDETDADRVGALARSDALGAALIRVLYQHDASALRSARDILGGRLVARGKIAASNPLLPEVCLKALEEHLCSVCGTCGGHKYTTDVAGVRSTCPECRGSGKGEHSAEERMRHLHIGNREYAALVQVFAAAQVILHAADTKVLRQVSKQLDRKKRG